jgi:undecaprenyl-diphosphatase
VNLLVAVLLGTVQGLTEFLPVSSSAHLILVRAVFGWGEDAFWLPFDVACHVGTLAAVLAFFWSDILGLVRALPRVVSSNPGRDGRHLRLIAVGTIPVVIVGVLWAHAIEESARTPVVAITTLSLGAILFFVAERARPATKCDDALSVADALIIGVAQTTALVPGVSRSGATIAAGLLLGFNRAAIARFSFLLSVPAILAAAAKEGLELRHMTLSAAEWQLFAVGMVSSATVGYFTIRFFLRYLVGHRLDVFAWYRLALAAVFAAWLFTR